MATRKTRERRERSKVSARKRAEEHKSGFSSKCYKVPDGTRMFSVKTEGVKRLDIIPYTVPEGANNPFAEAGELHFERTYYTHRDVGPDGDMYPCLKKTFNKPCPICDHRAAMLKDPDADENDVKALAPKERQLWNIFDHDDPDRGVQLWDFSFHLFGKQLDARVNNSDEEDGYEFFADPDEGMTLKVGFKEQSFGGNTFYQAETIDFKARKGPLDDELLEKALVLDSTLIRYDYDELKEIFLQTRTEDSPVREPKKSNRNEEDRPSNSRTRSQPKEEIEDDEEDFEEEQTPKQDAGGSKSKEKPATSAAKKSSRAKKESEDTTSDVSPSNTRKRRSSKSSESMPKASDFGLEVNMGVDHPEHGEDCTIIAISEDETAVYILDKDNRKHSVSPDSVTIIEYEEDEEEEKPKAKPTTKPKSKKAEKEPEPEPEPEDEDDGEWDDEWED